MLHDRGIGLPAGASLLFLQKRGRKCFAWKISTPEPFNTTGKNSGKIAFGTLVF
ncbi:hypothetical protein AB434_2778 [Heyndrickxia coagulans]|uniref:Uncharacterized protein n=1 Tax=Heyndrickxia coagulans TaxID=1398 RepID=A0AAN0T8Z5_HEYCO|nr:hypothetical protein SB48_HM08orf04006 [Heyndrickxia coagulans]AKN55183.1 hypothetical protein AB434_2778 [Heyndrickxia coagulans]KYC59206.1 hypothetical protein B4100_3707 [Heyndrickxia coagulans]KYC89683.1 hypothetical protein B4096_3625 [Heyndrickxia coagulans]